MSDDQQMNESATLQARIVRLEAELDATKAEVEHLRLFEQLIEALPDYVVVSNLENKIIYANAATLKGGGWSRLREFVDENDIADLTPPEEQPYIQQVVLPGLMRTGQAAWNSRFLRRDGSFFSGASSSFLIKDADGIPLGIASFIRDVTEQRAIEQRLRENERYLQAMLESVPIVLFALDREGRFTHSDGKALAVMGLEPGQVVGASFFEMYAPYTAFIAAARRALAGEQVSLRTETDGIGFDHWLTPIRDDTGEISGIVGVSIDVSAQLRAEEERIALQESVIYAQRNALRELSTPLVPITEGVLAMPLVGTISDERAQQIMETLLEGIAEQQADVAILDITGVRVVDTQVADALLRVARAARLLGTQVILTGIGAEVAQTLVGLGADMSGLQTAATLQEGIAASLMNHQIVRTAVSK